MKQIIRFDLQIEPAQRIDIPNLVEFLGFGTFNNKPAIWALVDKNESRVTNRTFVIFPENKEIPYWANKTNCVGRFEHKGADIGAHVLHVFEQPSMVQV